MSKPSARSVRSKQSAILRYIASSDISTTSAELGLSTKTLKRFLAAAPETVTKAPERFSRVLGLKPKDVAKEKQRRLVPKLSGERLKKAYQHQNAPMYLSKSGRKVKVDTDWTKRALRYTQATRTHRRVVTEEGIHTYVPVSNVGRENAQRQIVSGLAGENTRSLANKIRAGSMSRDEGLSAIRQLWKNSDAAFTPEQEAKYLG